MTLPINHSNYRPSSEVIAQRVGQETILLHLRTNRIFELNRTGTELWELLSRGYNRPQIQRQMLNAFDVDPGQLAREIDGVFSSLAAENLVEARDAD